MNNLEYFLPILQKTITYAKALESIEVKNDKFQSLKHFTLTTLTGIAETISYLALSVFYGIQNTPNGIQKARNYIMLSEGSWKALTLGIIAIWDKTYAATLPAKIEQLCDRQWNFWIKSSEKEIKLRLQKERKEIFEKLRQEDFSTRTRLLSKWEESNERLKKKIHDYIEAQKLIYPSLTKFEKYPALQKLKDTLHTFR